MGTFYLFENILGIICLCSRPITCTLFGARLFNGFPKRQVLHSSKMKDDKFEFDENGRKFSKRVENTVGKGEIARYEQFLLFSLCFQKNCTADS